MSTPNGSDVRMVFTSDKKIVKMSFRLGSSGRFLEIDIGDVQKAVGQSPFISKKEGKGYGYELLFKSSLSGEVTAVLQIAKGKKGKNGASFEKGTVTVSNEDPDALV